jgi:signal transduction histidine kinase
MPKKAIAKIFEPFFSFGKKDGTGLGMPTVKKIIEEHGGSIDIQSEIGLGVTIAIRLPNSPDLTVAKNSAAQEVLGSAASLISRETEF